MARINVPSSAPSPQTHEGAPAARIDHYARLRRSVLACMLWEGTFYESGEEIGKRIAGLIQHCPPGRVAHLAKEARTRFKLRHVPLLLIRELARNPHDLRWALAHTLAKVIQRADEITEFLAIYWKEKRQPLSAQVKKGLALAFQKFDEYQLAKYDRAGQVRLRDALFLCHAKPKDKAQAKLWKRLVNNELQTPDTWEVALSAAKTKAEKGAAWMRLLEENRLGALALLRNLRNMIEAGIPEAGIRAKLEAMDVSRVLPFRFLSAAKHAPQLEDAIERAMFRALGDREKLPGRTVLLVDVSGSMDASISGKSELMRWEAAAALAILAREVCEDCAVYTFDTNCRFVPARRGMALRDAIGKDVGGGTNTGAAIEKIHRETRYDRLIIFTDEQSHDRIPKPQGLGYVVNVSSDKNGIGYGAWTHIDGFSEAVLDFIFESERPAEAETKEEPDEAPAPKRRTRKPEARKQTTRKKPKK